VGRAVPVAMRRFLASAAVTLLLAGCASGPASSGGHAISGAVLAGPTCPVQRPDSPCPPVPWTGAVRATAADGSTFQTETDGSGHFRIEGLSPGTYTVEAVTSGLPRGVPLTVSLADADRTVTLQVDTGIR
jgi:carboxypeptidase family protein